MQSNDIINVLENTEAKSFIIRHLNDDVAELSLKYSAKTSFNLTICLQLIKIYQKSRHKLPHLSSFFPAIDERSYQQSTSELVAEFKASLISGKKLLDLTGGLGIDDIAFSKVFEEVISLDINEDLNSMFRYNLNLLNISNIQRLEKSADEMSDFACDWLYIDPDRRTEKQRLVLLEDLKPNILEILPKLQKQEIKLALKLSPLFEIKELLNLIDGIHSIYCISQANELKEVFVLIDHQNSEPIIHAIELGSKAFSYNGIPADWDITITEEENNSNYLYIPKAALSKAHLELKLAKELGLTKFAGFQLFTSSKVVHHQAFRSYKIADESSSGMRQIKAMLSSHNINKLNIIVKGSSKPISYWTKKLKLQEGGEYSLIIVFATINKAYLLEHL